MTEYWDLYDENGKMIDAKIGRGENLPEGAYHLSVDVWIINSKNEILIQKRSSNKKQFPNVWAESAGGAVISGENSLQGAVREIEEELGFIPETKNIIKIHRFVRRNNTLVDVYVLRQNIDIKDIYFDKNEISDVKWASFGEIMKLNKCKNFVSSVLLGLYKVMEAVSTRTHYGIYGLIEREDFVLLIKKKRGPYTGLYDLPGGTPEGDEAEVETLVREIKEETGSYVSNHKLISDISVVFDKFVEKDGKQGLIFHTGKLYKCEIEGNIDECINEFDSLGAVWVRKYDINKSNSSPLVLFALEK